MLRICACLFSLLVGFADTTVYKDEITFEQHGDRATLKVTMIRPLEAFASRFGGNTEDPFYRFPGDMAEASLYNPGMRPGTGKRSKSNSPPPRMVHGAAICVTFSKKS
jgi:hypothetical protein